MGSFKKSGSLLPGALPSFLSPAQIGTNPIECMQRALLHWGVESCIKIDRSRGTKPIHRFIYLDGERLSVDSEFHRFACQTQKAMPREFHAMSKGLEHPVCADFFMRWDRREFERLLAVPTEFGRPARKDLLCVPFRMPGNTVNVTVCSTERFSPEQKTIIYQTIVFFSDLLRLNASSGDEHRRLDTLTGRERSCIDWAVKGKTTEEISDILHISPETVKYRLRQAMRKYGVANRRQLIVQYAIDSGQDFL